MALREAHHGILIYVGIELVSTRLSDVVLTLLVHENRGQFATQRLSKQLDHTMKPYQFAESAPREAYYQRKMLLTLA